MNEAQGVTDPISRALAERREEVLAAEAAGEQLQQLLDGPATLSPDLLVGLLHATWARLPSMDQVDWTSPTARGRDSVLAEVLAIGAKVGDVLEVYSNALDEADPALKEKRA